MKLFLVDDNQELMTEWRKSF